MDTDGYDSLLRATSHRMHIQILNHCGIFHWIGSREILQETLTNFMGKTMVSG